MRFTVVCESAWPVTGLRSRRYPTLASTQTRALHVFCATLFPTVRLVGRFPVSRMQYRIFVFQYLWVRLRLRLEGEGRGSKTSPTSPTGSCETSQWRSVHLTFCTDVPRNHHKLTYLSFLRKKIFKPFWFPLSWPRRHPITLPYSCLSVSQVPWICTSGTCGRRHVAHPKMATVIR
jgi:hypothetical protein